MGQPPSPAQARLAAILRGLRDGAGLTTYELAERAGMEPGPGDADGEHAHRAASAPDDVEQWARSTGAPEAVRDELARSPTRRRPRPGPGTSPTAPGLLPASARWPRLERSATEILHFQPEAIPGLLQTEDYARRLLALR